SIPRPFPAESPPGEGSISATDQEVKCAATRSLSNATAFPAVPRIAVADQEREEPPSSLCFTSCVASVLFYQCAPPVQEEDLRRRSTWSQSLPQEVDHLGSKEQFDSEAFRRFKSCSGDLRKQQPKVFGWEASASLQDNHHVGAGRIAAFILTLQFQDLGTGGQIWDLWSENRVSSEPQSSENRVAGSHQVTTDLSSPSELLQPPPSQTRTAKLKLPIATGEAALFAGEIEKVRSRCCSPEKQTHRLRSAGEVAFLVT
ncbi:hypothetical protein Droror1_Dr00018223, partial [Drosera rotundifolia]